MNVLRMTAACAATGALMMSCAGQSAGNPGGPARPSARQDTVVETPVAPAVLEILSYAARASSSHNAQPWQLVPSGPGTLRLLADRSRYLPAVDPANREMFLSFGAFLETLDQAARASGYQAVIAVTADSKEVAEIATIRLDRKGGPRDTATLNLIASTYTPRGDLGTAPLDPETLLALGVSADGALRYLPPDSPAFRWVREEAPKAGLQQAWRDPAQEELAEFLHFSRKSARQAGYGLTPEMMEVAPTARLFWYAFMTPKSALSRSFRNSIEAITARQLEQCAGVFVLSSPGHSPAALIEAGRRYQRLKLAAFSRGIGVHPVSALLEEQPWTRQVDDTLGSDQPVQFILRTGSLQRELPDFQTDATTSASIRMRPVQFVAAP